MLRNNDISVSCSNEITICYLFTLEIFFLTENMLNNSETLYTQIYKKIMFLSDSYYFWVLSGSPILIQCSINIDTSTSPVLKHRKWLIATLSEYAYCHMYTMCLSINECKL